MLFPEAPDRNLYELARSLVLKTPDPIEPIANSDPVSYEEGRKDTFWVTDSLNIRTYTTDATLRLVSPHAYWYVEDGARVSNSGLARAAQVFEEEIYPRVTSAFGSEWTPGVDNDPRLTILHARLSGVHGYFSAVDEYPLTVHQHSNEREMIYLNSRSLGVGSEQYLGVLVHELQHAVHWNGDRSEETWVSEGLSELATTVAGQRPDDYVGNVQQDAFLRSPSTSLVNWPQHASPQYGATFLFFDYLSTHYGSRDDLLALVQDPADGIQGIDSYLAHLGYEADFFDVFTNWVIANYLDEPGTGPYSYPNVNVGIIPSERLEGAGERISSIPQYSAEYTAIDVSEGGDVLVRFKGQRVTSMLPVDLETERCWWSNRGDSISSTLTRSLDLSGVERATLEFRTWFDVEDQWDYGYVQVSSDGGLTWDIVEAPATSPGNPVGNSFGPGYTGSSDAWLQQEVDLRDYAGQEILLRFHYVTDLAVNYTGQCIDQISVPEIGFVGQDAGDDGWEADGFISIDNEVPQKYIVQVIKAGNGLEVTEMELDEDNRGEMVIRGLESLREAVVVVAALAPKTLQEAAYSLTIERVP